MKSGWSVVMMLVAGCAAKTLSAGGTPTDSADAGHAAEGPGASFDAGNAGDAIELAIVDVLAPSTPVNGLCTYTADANQASLASGTVDLAFASLTEYQPVVLVESLEPAAPEQYNAIVLVSTTTNITDTTGGSVVSLLQRMCSGATTGTKDLAACQTGQQLGEELTVPTVPFVSEITANAGVGLTSQSTTLTVTLLDAATIALLRAYFTAAIALNGASALDTTFDLLTYTVVDGVLHSRITPVASNVYEFPVTVTYGSLVSNLRTDPSSAVGTCLDTTMIPSTAQTCVPGQDAPAPATSVDDPAISTCPIPDAG